MTHGAAPTTWEAEAGGSEFKMSLVFVVSSSPTGPRKTQSQKPE